jgi:hypothetical protein
MTLSVAQTYIVTSELLQCNNALRLRGCQMMTMEDDEVQHEREQARQVKQTVSPCKHLQAVKNKIN